MEEAEEVPSWVENLDENDAGNPLAVVDYVEDIYDFYRKTEVKSIVDSELFSSKWLNDSYHTSIPVIEAELCACRLHVSTIRHQ